jgi:Tfp pilus assembly protein PilZ
MNQRKERRIEERNTVVIRSAGSPKGPSTSLGVNVYTYDLSLGGTRLITDRPFATGTIVRIVIELAKTCQKVQVDGEVKWMRKNETEGVYEIGVEFLHHISQTILSLIRHLYGMGNGVTAIVSPSAAAEKTGGEPETLARETAATPPAEQGAAASNSAGPESRTRRGKKRKAAARKANADERETRAGA